MQRRRFIRIVGCALGLGLLPGFQLQRGPWRFRWRGSALGAEARIDLWMDGSDRARRLVALCVAELDRLEGVFSLQRRDSALSILNRQGRLLRPPLELVSVLEAAGRISELTGGAFDATVQPLWRLYTDHFAGPDADPAGPSPGEIERVGRLVDHGAVDAAPHAVRFARPGMAVTLNGIAQGFIADRIAALVQDHGAGSVLLDVGEVAAVGPPPGGGEWQVRAGSAGPVLGLAGGAVATSSPAALTFDAAGRFPHLLDPSTLRPGIRATEVSVVADSAMIADALSTALAVRPAALPRHRLPGVRSVVRRALPSRLAESTDRTWRTREAG
jgi:FAD:protein FMN transferase